ncbi:MAG: hypothetical protein ACE14T_05020 [Syntrophales bacterium]
MKKTIFIISLALTLAFVLSPAVVQSQPGRGGYGYGMGPGMMGPGYVPQYRTGGKPIDLKEAKAMMSDYLKSSRNPNLKLGKIKDSDRAFEAEIRTRSNVLVDRILIDKETGYIRSAY